MKMIFRDHVSKFWSQTFLQTVYVKFRGYSEYPLALMLDCRRYGSFKLFMDITSLLIFKQ